jgi:hypothetical protein
MAQHQVNTLKNASVAQASKDHLSTSILLPLLRAKYDASYKGLPVGPNDLNFAAPIPDETIDGSCSHHITAHGGHFQGVVYDTSYLHWGADNISWTGINVWLEAKLNAGIEIGTSITVSTGAKLLGHCRKIAQKTTGVAVSSKGKNGVGIDFAASNAHVELAGPTGLELVFNFHAEVYGTVIEWDVENVDVSRCTISILGIKILSYCGVLKKMIHDGVSKMLHQTQKLAAPKIQSALENAINTAVGSVVRIPIQL